MHQRSGARNIQQHGALLGTAATTSKSTITKKLLLWLVLLLQICFIGCFWLLQSGLSAPGGGNAAVDNGIVEARLVNERSAAPHSKSAVNFITNALYARYEKKSTTKMRQFANVNDFRKDFFLKPNRLNRSEAEEEMAMPTDETQLWCFREGSIKENSKRHDSMEDDLLQLDFEQCACEPNWHGRDCGQPEVIWRALMTAKRPFKLLNPSKDAANRLVYLLEGHFFSLDLLELQIRLVFEVVDYFVIFLKHANVNVKEWRALQRRLRSMLSSAKYTLLHCSQSAGNCSATHAYRQFKMQRQTLPWQLKPHDLLLYSNESELLGPSALKFLKYYAADAWLMRFRLKHNVYGFYWQHPAQTQLGSLLSSFVHLDNPLLGNANLSQLLQRAKLSESAALIVGDLNHYGGWLCQYCQQPDEIIAALQTDLSSFAHVQFPNATRNRHIDAAYLQKLIANGLYVNDGKTQLLKLRRQAEHYYAPVYAERHSWKYGHLLVNLYESLQEDDFEDEAAAY